MLQVPHSGFDEMEVEALGSFCEYYGVNINYDTTCVPEFMNPLFLKMLCEIAIGKEDKTVVVEDIQTLMGEFFDVKNKIISKYYAEYFSVKDKVVSLALSAVTQYMAEHDRYSMTWFELRTVIAKVLAEFGIQEKAAGFIKLLISENLLREADEKGVEITFAYQKFYEYLYAQKYLDVEVEIIVEAVENKKITLGTLEMIQILFLRNTKEELIAKIDERIHGEVVETFMSGLYWRNANEINEKTIAEIEKLLSSSNESDMRRVILGLIAIATKKDCAINAYYVHKKLSNMSSYRRDFILSLFLLKQYDQVKIISDTCERAIVLKHPTFAEDSILLWKIILCWGTGSNDIKLRDKASKGLTNLFRLYPLDMLTVINMFKDIDDDYIHERIWQAVYSSLIVLAEQKYVMPILEYIKNSIILVGIWPQNVLLRDYLRNIFEYAYYKGWCTEKEVILVRPPYRSTMVNYLGQEEEQDFRQENPAPCYLITTANDYTAEKDSPFCTNEESSYMFPSKFLMEQMNLTWDGSFGYAANGSIVIVNGQNNALFIKKKFLLEFIEENELDVVWTVLGEKQKITGGFGRDFPGRAEFSYTYYINEKEEVSRNHKVYNIMEAGRY